jgi:hypothetical protein
VKSSFPYLEESKPTILYEKMNIAKYNIKMKTYDLIDSLMMAPSSVEAIMFDSNINTIPK